MSSLVVAVFVPQERYHYLCKAPGQWRGSVYCRRNAELAKLVSQQQADRAQEAAAAAANLEAQVKKFPQTLCKIMPPPGRLPYKFPIPIAFSCLKVINARAPLA